MRTPKLALVLIAAAACHKAGAPTTGSSGSAASPPQATTATAGSATSGSAAASTGGSAGGSAAAGSDRADGSGAGSAGAGSAGAGSAGAGSAAAGDLALDVQPMTGPFPTPAALCDALKKQDQDSVVLDCEWNAIPGAPAAPAPYREAKLGLLSRDGSYAFELALRTGDGWYAAFIGSGEVSSGHSGTDTKLGAQHLAYTPMPTGAPVVVLHARIDQTGFEPNDVQKDDYVLVCGVGASSKPSCTAPIPAQQVASGEPAHQVDVSVSGGRLVVTASGSHGASEDQTPFLGSHALQFP